MAREAPGRGKGQRANGAMSLARSREIVTPWASGEALGVSGMDLLMWVGYQSYPTTEAFAEEAKKIGISKRVGRIPPNLVPGSTRLWIVHDGGETGQGRVIGYGTITGVDVLGVTELPEGAPPYARLVTKAEMWREPTYGGQMRRRGIYIRTEDFVPIRPREATKISRYRGYKWMARRRLELLKMADPGVEPDPVPPNRKWTPEEINSLVVRAHEIGPFQAAKEHARTTERSLEAAMYQWKKWLREQQNRA